MLVKILIQSITDKEMDMKLFLNLYLHSLQMNQHTIY